MTGARQWPRTVDLVFLAPLLLVAAGAFLSVSAEQEPERQRASTLLADLPPEVRAALEGVDPPLASLDSRAILETVYRTGGPSELDLGDLVARTDTRWFASLPDEEPGSAIVELRRWPGDTVLAIYAVSRERDPATAPPVPNSRFDPRPTDDAATVLWEGWLTTSAGERPALWAEREVPGARARLAALVLPGDAGLGAGAVETLVAEALLTFSRLRVREAGWKLREGLAPGEEVRVPAAGIVPGEKSEEETPWQVAVARDFTVGLPPGVRAARPDLGVPLSRHVPGAQLWLRGRYRDAEGTEVAIGDETRFGYVARIEPPEEAWSSSRRPPAGAGSAKRVALRPFGLAVERTGAREASAERWQEPGFVGEWLVFRLVFDEAGFEIGLPVLRGRRSPSLFWIPATWRGAGRAPAPPPVDPAERFGIRFERLSRVLRKDSPWVEGHLTVPGMRAEVSRGWLPLASLRSSDGYPVRFVDSAGATLGRLIRVEASDLEARLAELEDPVELKRPARYRADRVLRDAAGRYLFVAAEGHAFLFELDLEGGSGTRAESEAGSEAQERLELWRLMMQSVRLERENGP